MGSRKEGVKRFFAFARERHEIYLRRAAGQDRPWTRDPILQRYRFTNVYRELDKTTVWFEKYVRGSMASSPQVLLATVVFRMLNRTETGEAVFCQSTITDEGDLHTAFEKFVIDGRTGHLKHAIRTYVGKQGPYVTGAYIISSPPGYSKLDGVMKILEGFAKKRCENAHCGYQDWECVTRKLIAEPGKHTLESVWRWLREYPYLGAFHSYEIVTDLRHTDCLRRAPDVDTWASVGPGARRGLNRVAGRDLKDHSLSAEETLEEMRGILECSRDREYWPQGSRRPSLPPPQSHPRWEMREVEHTLCEFDKYERVRLGEGRPRGVYR